MGSVGEGIAKSYDEKELVSGSCATRARTSIWTASSRCFHVVAPQLPPTWRMPLVFGGSSGPNSISEDSGEAWPPRVVGTFARDTFCSAYSRGARESRNEVAARRVLSKKLSRLRYCNVLD